MTEAFHRWLVTTPLHFYMYNINVRELSRFYDKFSFDRIDVSNIVAICFLGAFLEFDAHSQHVHLSFKNPKWNLCATLLTSFVEALQHS